MNWHNCRITWETGPHLTGKHERHPKVFDVLVLCPKNPCVNISVCYFPLHKSKILSASCCITVSELAHSKNTLVNLHRNFKDRVLELGMEKMRILRVLMNYSFTVNFREEKSSILYQ